MKTLRHQMDVGTMSRYQWGTSALCVLLNIIDGFDILIVAYTATSLTADWGLSGTQIGVLLSSGLFGMAAGTMLLSPLADKIGRRPLLLFCVALAGLGMLAAAAAPNFLVLAVIRVITGLGMGGIIVSAGVIASEFSSKRWRGLAVSINSAGYAFGAVVGGLAAVWLLSFTTWRGVFVFGAVLTLATFVVLVFRMPESVDYLQMGRSRDALTRINTLALKMGKDPVQSLEPAQSSSAQGKTRVISLLTSAKYRTPTIFMCLAFFLLMAGYYFVQSWTPSLLVDSGYSEAQGNLGGTVLNIGGMVGAVGVGVILARFPLKNVLVTAFIVTTLLMASFALLPTGLVTAFIISALIGMAACSSMAGLYALATGAYEAGVRSTAVGLGVTVGRFGAIVAPAVAGGLVDLNWGSAGLYLLMAPTFLIAGLAVTMIRLQVKDATDDSPAAAESSPHVEPARVESDH